MPVWAVQIAGGEQEQVEAGLLATEAGALVALSEAGLLLRAWAPGQWRTVRYVDDAGLCPPDPVGGDRGVLVGLPGR